MKENTNTDARKSAEIALEQITGYVQGNQLNIPKSWIIDAMVSFAEFQSRPATLDKVQGIAYCAMKPDGSIYYATEKLSDKDFTFWSPTLSDGKLFSSVEDLKDTLKEVDNYVIKTVLLNSLSEQPEAKPTESEHLEKLINIFQERYEKYSMAVGNKDYDKGHEHAFEFCLYSAKEALNSLKQ